MPTVIVWSGNPSSGGTGFVESAADPHTAFIAARHRLPITTINLSLRLLHYFQRARLIDAPIVRVGDASYSVEIRQ